MKRLVLTILCCFCAMSGFAELNSDTKLGAVETKETIIQKKIDALRRESDVVLAEIKSELEKTDFDENREVTISEKFLNSGKIISNIGKANVELQEARLRAGKTTKECVKLDKINFDIFKADVKEDEADVKVEKAALKIAEFKTGIDGVVTDENRVKLAEARIEEAKARLERSVAIIKKMNLSLKGIRTQADIIKTINTTATKDEDIIAFIINQREIDIKNANESVVQAKSFVDECEQDLKEAKANVELKKNEVKNGKTIKEYVKLAKLELAIAKTKVKWSKISLKVAESHVKLNGIIARIDVDELRAKTGGVATGENHVEEKNSINIHKAS